MVYSHPPKERERERKRDRQRCDASLEELLPLYFFLIRTEFTRDLARLLTSGAILRLLLILVVIADSSSSK